MPSAEAAGLSVEGVLGLIGAFGYGALSALVPVFNAEAFVAVLGGTSRHWVIGVLALSLGTAAGKLAILIAARRGATWLDGWDRRRRRRAGPAPREAKPGRWTQRRQAWGEAMLRHLDRRWVSGAVVLTSATVGIPPLALVAVLAGLRRTPVPVFVVAVFIGRAARFLALAAPFAAATS